MKRRRYASVESAARDYVRMRELEAPASLHRLEESEACRWCGSGRKTTIGGGPTGRGLGRRTGTAIVCSSCRAPWTGRRISEVVRGSRRAGGGNARVELHADLAAVRAAFEARPRDLTERAWQLGRFVLLAELDPRVGSLARAVALGRGELEDRHGRKIAPPAISGLEALELEEAKALHREVRAAIAARLERAGLWGRARRA